MLTSKYTSEKAWEKVPVPYPLGTKVTFNVNQQELRTGIIFDYRYSFGRPRASSFALAENPDLFYPVSMLYGCEVEEE